MARGDLTEFRVNPTLTETPRVDAPPVKSAAPQQLMQVGQALERAGGAAGQLFEDQLREANKVKVDEALIKASDAALDYTFGDNGYTKLNGNDALERPDGKSLAEEYGGNYDNELNNIEQGLGNSAQRNAFKQAASRMALDLRGKIGTHTARQFEVHKENVFNAGVENGQNTVMLYARDAEKTREGLARLDALAGEYADRMGMDSPEERDAIRRKLGTPAVLGAISALGDAEDWDAADKYFEQHRDRLDGVGQLKAYELISNGQDAQAANRIGDETLAGLTGTQAANEPQGFISPVGGSVAHAFGEARGSRSHKGVDIAVPVGSSVHAPISGRVKIKNDPNGYGNYYVIDAGDGHTEVRLAHLSELGVKDGDVVTQGQVMGKSGGARGAPGSGNSKGPHLHYEVRVDGQPVDPTGKLKTKGGAMQGGGVPSVTEGIRAIRARTDIRESVKDAAIRRFQQGHALVQAEDEDRKKKARDAAYMYAYQHPGANLPPAMVSAMDPTDLPGAVGFSNAMRERAVNGVEVSESTSLQTYARVRTGIANGTITDVNAVLREAPNLTRADAKQLVNDITSVSRGDQSKVDSLKNSTEVLSKLKSIGAVPKELADDDAAYGEFAGAFYQRVARLERDQKRSLTGDEMRAQALALMADTGLRGTRNFGRGDVLPMYQVENQYYDIDPSVRGKIVSELQKNGVPRPSIRQVVEVYRKTQ